MSDTNFTIKFKCLVEGEIRMSRHEPGLSSTHNTEPSNSTVGEKPAGLGVSTSPTRETTRHYGSSAYHERGQAQEETDAGSTNTSIEDSSMSTTPSSHNKPAIVVLPPANSPTMQPLDTTNGHEGCSAVSNERNNGESPE